MLDLQHYSWILGAVDWSWTIFARFPKQDADTIHIVSYTARLALAVSRSTQTWNSTWIERQQDLLFSSDLRVVLGRPEDPKSPATDTRALAVSPSELEGIIFGGDGTTMY